MPEKRSKAAQPLFNRVAFIGIGLIGASMALAMKRNNLAGEIVACARRDETLHTAANLKIVDTTTKD